MDSSCSSTLVLDDQGGGTTISTVHPDIIQSHILTRLDGPTLASAACVSSQLRALSTEDRLWRDICSSTWPSVDDPRVSDVISAFPSGHRAFYGDSFPLILDRDQQPLKSNPGHSTPTTTKLISAVDIFYKDKPIFSRVQETETVSGWFLSCPFRVDLLDQKETVPTPVRQDGDEAWLKHLEDELRLSWILIDPTRKRAANISTGKPVLVQRHWLTREVQSRFATIMVGDGRRGSETEFVDCGLVVTWGGNEAGEELHLSEVSMLVEDMEGRNMNGRDSLVILQDALESGKRGKGRSGKGGRERYEEFVEKKRQRNEGKQRREAALDMACIATGVTVFLCFWTFILFR